MEPQLCIQFLVGTTALSQQLAGTTKRREGAFRLTSTATVHASNRASVGRDVTNGTLPPRTAKRVSWAAADVLVLDGRGCRPDFGVARGQPGLGVQGSFVVADPTRGDPLQMAVRAEAAQHILDVLHILILLCKLLLNLRGQNKKKSIIINFMIGAEEKIHLWQNPFDFFVSLPYSTGGKQGS